MSILSNEIRKKRQQGAGKATSPPSGTDTAVKTGTAGQAAPSVLRSAILSKRAGNSVGSKGVTAARGAAGAPTLPTLQIGGGTAARESGIRENTSLSRLKKAADEERLAQASPEAVRLRTLPGERNAVADYIQMLRSSPAQVEYEKANRAAAELKKRAETNRLRSWANEHPVLGSAASVGSSMLSGVDYLKRAAETAAIGESLPTEIPMPSETTEALRGGASQDMGKVGKFLYDTGMSGVDSVAASFMGPMGAVVLGAGAASSAANDIIARGGSDEQALIGGAAAGAFESFFEKFSIGELNALKEAPVDSAKTLLKNVMKSTLTNTSEEAMTELANVLFDAGFMGELSNYALLVKDFTAEGMNEKDAKRKARGKMARQIALAGAAGGLMGAAFGGYGSLNGYMYHRGMGQEAAWKSGSFEAQRETAQEERSPGPVLSPAETMKSRDVKTVEREEIPAQGQRTEDGGSLLLRAIEEAAQQGRVTNRTAAEIWNEPDAMGILLRRAGLNVREGMSKSQQREAVKSAVDTLVQRQRLVETLNGYPTLQQLARGEWAADANAAALEAMDAMDKGIISRELGRELVRQAAEDARSQSQQAGQEQTVQAEQPPVQAEQTAPSAEQTPVSAEESAPAAESREPGFYGAADEVDEADARYLDRLAKAAGVSMERVSAAEAGQRQGWIINGRVYLSEQTEDPLRTVAKHEVTHRMQELAADSYSEYRSYVEEVCQQEGTLDESIRMRQELYRRNGQELTYDQALDELAADYAGELLVNEQLIDRLAQGKPSLARRVLDAIRDVLARLKRTLRRSEVEPLEQAARLWEQALRDTNRAYWQEGQRTESGEVRSSIRETTLTEEVGRDRMEETTRQEDDHYGNKEGRAVSEIAGSDAGSQAEARDRPRVSETGGSIESGVRRSVSPEEVHQARGLIEKAAGEYRVPVEFVQAESWPAGHETHAAYSSEGKIYVREGTDPAVAAEIIPHEATHVMKQTGFQPYLEFLKQTPEMLDWSNEDGRTIIEAMAEHRNIDPFSMSQAEADILYDEINAIVSGGIMSGQDAQIRERLENAFYDYDLYRDEVERIHREFQRRSESRSTGETGTQTEKKSVKGTRALQKQVEALTRQNQRLKEQMKRTDTVKASRKAVEQQAREIRKAYQSRIDKAALADRIDSLYQKMGQLGSSLEDGGGPIVTEKDIRTEARGIAEDILAESRANVNPMAEEYATLRKELRGRRLYLAVPDRAHMAQAGGYNEFRKRNMGSLTLSNKGTAVDVAYQELNDRYPDLFPDDIYHPADQLLRIGEVVQDLKQVEGNPYEQELAYTAQYLAGELMEQFYDTAQAKPTLADRMKQRYQDRRLKDRKANQQRFEKQQTEYRRWLKEMEDSYRDQNRQRIENQSARERRETIRRGAERLGRKLVRPTDKQHVPQEFQGAALAFVRYLDLGSSYEMVYGTDGKYHRVKVGSELSVQQKLDDSKMPSMCTRDFVEFALEHNELGFDTVIFRNIIDGKSVEVVSHDLAKGYTRGCTERV